jgi:DNA-directed RNA polymerase omega subunit
MSEMYNTTSHEVINEDHGERWPGVDSRFRLVMVAAQRSKQLQRGARPRVAADPLRRRPTSIALEEIKQGLVTFDNNTKEGSPEGDSARDEAGAAGSAAG